MKKILFSCIVVVFVFSLLGINNTVYSQQKEKILKGQIVDVLSYAQTGKVNKDVTTESAKTGKLLGILSGGKVYIAFSKDAKINEMLSPYAADKIVAKGLVYTKGTNAIILSNIDKDMKAK